MQAKVPYKNLKHTLQCLKIQVIDSLPYISAYIPSTIATPSQLFYFLRNNVVYKKDPLGVELLQTVQTLMARGGQGDCDCFTILTLASCYYLKFEPQQVALVGKTEFSPTHIYSMVYDPARKKMCAMDLTNPRYDMERKTYRYKQTLDFMILQMEDGFPLSGKAHQAKKALKKTKRVQKKSNHQLVKIRKNDSKTNKKLQHSVRRTNKANAKTKRQSTHQDVRQERRNKGMIKVKGRQDIIRARQSGKLDKVNQKYAIPDSQDQDIDASYDPTFSPESDQSYIPDDNVIPGSDYQASGGDQGETVDVDYEEVPGEEEQGLSAGAILSVIKGAGKGIIDQVKGQAKDKAATLLNSDQVKQLVKDNADLQAKLDRQKIYGIVFPVAATAAGIGIGYYIGKK